jgi:hypothetical protein
MESSKRDNKTMDGEQDQKQQLLGLLKNVIDLAELLFKERALSDELNADNVYNLPLLIIYFKSIKTGKAIHHLCKENFGEDAGSLVRSLVESRINFHYLAKEPNKNGLLYRRYAAVTRLAYHKSVRQIASDLTKDDFDWMADETAYEEALKEIDEKLGQIDRAYDKKKRIELDHLHRWSGKSLGEMARKVGIHFEQEYQSVYPVLSNYVHPNPDWLIKVARQKADEIIIDLRTEEPALKQIIAYTSTSLLDLIRKANEFFSLNRENEIKVLLDDFDKIDPITVDRLMKLKEFSWFADPKIRENVVLRFV